MALFKSVVVKRERKNKDGEIIEAGETVFVPQDKAAFLEPVCDKALALGLILKEDGKAYTEAEFRAYQEKLAVEEHKAQVEDMKKRQDISGGNYTLVV